MRRLCLLLIVMLAACEQSAPPARQAAQATVQIGQRMGAEPDPGFARATVPRPFEFPADHGAHPAYATEWWYFTGNLHSDDGARFGYQLTLFRIGLTPDPAADDSDWRTGQIYMGHLAVSDLERRLHHSRERFSRAAVGLAGAQSDPLRVWLGPWSIEGEPGDPFPVRLDAADSDMAIALTLERGNRPLVLQGERGLSRKGHSPGNASYYYSYTRLPTRGEIRIENRQYRVSGNSWFDREWSSSALATDQAGWDWFALQLDDGRDLMFYRLRGKDGAAQPFSSGVLVDTDGTTHTLSLDSVQAVPMRTWQDEDGVAYPVAWHLSIPQHALDLNIEAAFDEQAMRHTVHYWEGAVVVSGSHSGVGYLELSGYVE